jgi:hypothetical protein
MVIRSYIQPEMFILGVRSMKMHLNVSQVSTIARRKYHQNSLVRFKEKSERPIPSSIICQATGRYSSLSAVKYCTRDYSELT